MPKKPQKTWILIADGARARILHHVTGEESLEPVLEEADLKSRQHTRELGTDKPGRTHESIADGSRHAMAPRVDWHEFEKHLFAKEVAKILNHATQEHAFDRLVLVAPPKILGELRNLLDKTTQAHVTAEINKDLTGVPLHDLPVHLDAALKIRP
ncbi:MAG: host attachment protein [Alphaproteobacteria bacterium]